MAQNAPIERWDSSKALFWEASSKLRRIFSHPWAQAGLIALLVLVVYLPFKASDDPVNQYIRLADAWLHGHVDIQNPPHAVEAAEYKGHYYVYHPPAPAVFLLPGVALFGLDFNQAIVAIVLAAASVGLTLLMLQRLGVSNKVALWVTFLLGFGTTLWFTSVAGGSSYLSHVSAVFFLTLAIYVALSHKQAFLVGALLALAALSRNAVLFGLPFFAIVYLQTDRRYRNLAFLAAGVAFPFILTIPYNYLRYETIFDVSYSYSPIYSLTGDPAWIEHGRVSLNYIKLHIVSILFLAPEPIKEFPYFAPNFVGMGLFFTTPAFLYAFRAPIQRISVASALAIALIMIPNVTFWATGWYQFGYRYSLDFTPFLLILVAKAMDRDFGLAERGVILLSAIVNFWGVWVILEKGMYITDVPKLLTDSVQSGFGL